LTDDRQDIGGGFACGKTDVARLLSIIAVVVIWAVAAALAHSRMLPGPLSVAAEIVTETVNGELPYQMGCTLARVIVSFSIAFVLGSFAGYAMGRWKAVDRYGDSWLIVLLNLPALVTIIFAYIWIGLTETAAILAVALNKLPNVLVVVREGTRSLDPGLDEMARAFRLTGFVRMRHVVIPQLAPYFAAASRSGLSIAWKIVLVAELIGRPNGVGFVLGSAFSLFDLTKILSYTLTFVALMLTIENLLVQPLERRAQRWRRRA
jgi:NitT/TauT family transport system permease protein